MPKQLSLPGLEVPAECLRLDIGPKRHGQPQLYKLFFGLFLPPGDTPRVFADADELCVQRGLIGPRVAADRLHITLQVVEDFRDCVPLAMVDAARAAAATVACPSLPIVFDHALSFQPKNTFVLRCDSRSDAAIARLRQTLALALRRVGLRPASSYTPHMTLMYKVRQVPEQPITPIRWTATEFALVLSHFGKTHHQCVARWPLADKLPSPPAA